MGYYIAISLSISQTGWGKGDSPDDAAKQMLRYITGYAIRPLGFFVVYIDHDEPVAWDWDVGGFRVTDPENVAWEYVYKGKIHWKGKRAERYSLLEIA